MTITITLPVLLTALGIAVILTVHIIVVARYTARIQFLTEQNTADIKSLRTSRGEHADRLLVVEKDLEVARDNIGLLLSRRRDDPHPEGA